MRGHVAGGGGRRLGPVDQAVGAGMHELQVAIGIDVAGEGQTAVRLVDAQDRADETGLALIGRVHLERKEQGRRRQVARIITQVGPVDVEGRFVVEFEQDIAAGLGHLAQGAEGEPAAEDAMVETQGLTAQAEGDDRLTGRAGGCHDQGLLEPAAVPGQPAGDRDAVADGLVQPLDQSAAIDRHSWSEDDDGVGVGRFQFGPQALTGAPAVIHVGQFGRGDRQPDAVEVDEVEYQGVVGDPLVGNFAGGTAADQDGARTVGRDPLTQAGLPEQGPGTKDQGQIGIGGGTEARQRGSERGQFADLDLLCFHGSDVSGHAYTKGHV